MDIRGSISDRIKDFGLSIWNHGVVIYFRKPTENIFGGWEAEIRNLCSNMLRSRSLLDLGEDME